MANINLLPWREEVRERQKKQYLGMLSLIIAICMLMVYVILSVLQWMTDSQLERNQFLQAEIHLLDKQIAEIKDIKQQRKDIERRTEIILHLQQARNLPTHILNELARIVPSGVYLSSVEKTGSMLWVDGRSESNNNVANMMRKVSLSPWLHEPNVQSIVSHNEQMRQLQQFNLSISVSEKPLIIATEQGDLAK